MSIRPVLILIFLVAIRSNCDGRDLKSGDYEYLSVVCNNNEVYGLFEYYDRWNKGLNDYENQTVFYFYGKNINKDTIPVKVGMLGEKGDGWLVLHGGDSVTLFFTGHFQPGSYSVINFNKEGYTAKLEHTYGNTFVGLGIVKDEKCMLYKAPVDTAITKGYLVADDCVAIIQYQKDWAKISYTSPNPNVKNRTIRWIKLSALCNKDPSKW